MRLSRSLLPLMALTLAVVASCAPSNLPPGYDATTKANFQGTCTGSLAIGGTTTTLSSSSYCECAYDVFVANVPYDDADRKDRDGGSKFAGYDGKTYVQLDEALKDDANALPDSLKKKLQGCPAEQVTKGSTVGSAPPGSAVASAPAGTAVSTTTP